MASNPNLSKHHLYYAETIIFLMLPAVDHGVLGVACEPPLGEVIHPVDDRVDAAVQHRRQVKDVFHNNWNLNKVH